MADSDAGERPYRFTASIGWLAHTWKSATRQDHASMRPVLRDMLPAAGVAIDVGAHGGQVARLLAGLAGPEGHVSAVEPSGYARSVLRIALWARRMRTVTVVAAALGDRPDVARLRTPIKRAGDLGYGLAHIAGAPNERASVIEYVPVVTLDQLVDTLSLHRLDFIKADIEGHEAALIAGARRTLERYRPALLLEQDSKHLARAGSSLAALWDDLIGARYRPFHLEAPTTPLSQPRDGDIIWRPD